MEERLLVSTLFFISLLCVSEPKACYSTPCAHGQHLQDCIHGRWECHEMTEFCQITVHDQVKYECKAVHELEQCVIKESRHWSECDPNVLQHVLECTFCCLNQTCVHALTTSSTETSKSSTDTSTKTAAATETTLVVESSFSSGAVNTPPATATATAATTTIERAPSSPAIERGGSWFRS